MVMENGNDRDLMCELKYAAAKAEIWKMYLRALLEDIRRIPKGEQNDDIRNQGKGQGIFRIGSQLV